MLKFGQLVARNSKIVSNAQFKRALATAANQPKVQTEKKDAKLQPNFSFMANMFRGELEASQVFPYPDTLTDEQRETIQMFVDPVTKFFTEVNDPVKNDDTATIDEATQSALWELGGMSFQVPAEYGGIGANNTQYARMGEIVGANDLGLGICLGAHQSIGFKGILLFGTPEQKKKYLPMVTDQGRVFAAFCLTEPGSGSDASSIKTRAVLSPDGKHFILNGSKIWISNGGIANILTVFAKTEVVDPKTGKPRDKVTAFIVERGFGGVSNGPPEKKMGIKCSNTAEVYFEDCKVPIENVIGEVGDGFKVAMQILNNGRFGMAGTLAGTMATCIKKASEFAANRLQFGKKIEEFEGVQEKLSRMATVQYVAQSMAYMISGNMDRGSQDYHLEAAISKVFASEAAWYVCDEAIQIMGGMGFMKETGLERILRDLRIFRIFEGTNDILRLFVALTGIQYAGSHLKELQKAFRNPTAHLGLILNEFLNRSIRSVGFGGVDLSQHVHPSLQDSAKLCGESIQLFGKTVEQLLIKHGKGIVDQQFLLNRLADCAIDTYGMVVVLSRATTSLNKKLDTADHERLMAEAWCIEAYDRIQVNNKKIHNPAFHSLYGKMSKISKTICANQGVVTVSPIDV